MRRNVLWRTGHTELTIRLGQYNLLGPTNGSRLAIAEAIDETGLMNWDSRWPMLLQVIDATAWDVLCLQEIDYGTEATIKRDLTERGYVLETFAHPAEEPGNGRLAGTSVGIAYDPMLFDLSRSNSHQVRYSAISTPW